MLAVALGVGLVVAVSCCYESLRVSVTEWILSWLGRSQIHIEHRLGTSATFEQSLLEQVRRTEGVRLAAPRSRFWMTLIKPPYRPGAELPPQARLPVDCYGIEPTVEYQVRGYKLEAGRLLQPGEADAIVLQADLAETLHRRPGQSVMLEDATGKALQLRLVGTVVKPRLGPFQRSSAYVLLSRLQEMAYSRDKIHTIDVLVEPDASVQRVQQRLRDSLPPYVVIDTSESKLRHINDGMRLLNLVLLLNSICALLAAVFVIFSALNMGIIERMVQLGMLRCLGATRLQVAALVFIEAVPVGLVGVAAGIGLGIVVSKLAVLWYANLFGKWHLSVSGLHFAGWGGLAATLLASLIPAAMASAVSPMAAARPRSIRPRAWLDFLAAGLGLLCLGAQAAVIFLPADPFAGFKLYVVVGFPVLVAGCVLVAPILIRFLSAGIALPLAAVLRIRSRLLMDQFGRSGWRNAAICCAMMIGLAFMVNLLTNTESVIAGWQFPRKFPDALMWSFQALDDEQIRRARQTPGIAALTPVTTIPVRMAGEADRQVSALRRLLRSEPMIHFVGADLDSFGDLVELRFQAGDPQQAWQALAGGDAVIVAKEFSNSFGKGLGETVALQTPGGQVHRFRIVGIVDSPGIEVATDFFDQRSAYQRRALGALIGTRRDCRRIFGTDLVNLLLFNFSFEGELDRAARASAERAIITRMAQRIGLGRAAIRRPPGTDEFSFAYFLRQGLGYVAFSARELKLLIEQDFRRGILWLVFAAAVALAVAALGVANGMMANIASRAKQIAILRAIGMTRGQVVRMVLAEALTLGLIGAVFGLVLGLYLASVANWIDYRLFGFEPILSIPWSWIAAGIGLTVGGCLVAGLLPILSAARSNIVDALRLA